MLRAKWLLVAGVLLLVGGVLWGEDVVPPGMKAPAPGRVKGQRLLLPEVEGYLDAPGPGWVWYEQAAAGANGSMGFYCFSSGTGSVLGVLLEPSKAFLSPKNIGAFLANVHRGATKQGGKILKEECIPVAVPNHENVYRLALHAELGDGEERRLVNYVFSTGTYLTTLMFLGPEEQETQEFKDFCAGLKYRKVVPSVSAPPAKARQNLAFGMAVAYVVWGCLFGGVAMLLNKLMKRKVASPTKVALITVLALFAVRLCLTGLSPNPAGEGEESMAYQQGQEIGCVLFPLIILVYMYRDEQKKEQARAAAAAAAPTGGVPPSPGAAPPPAA
jgi:hypothetical protein